MNFIQHLPSKTLASYCLLTLLWIVNSIWRKEHLWWIGWRSSPMEQNGNRPKLIPGKRRGGGKFSSSIISPKTLFHSDLLVCGFRSPLYNNLDPMPGFEPLTFEFTVRRSVRHFRQLHSDVIAPLRRGQPGLRRRRLRQKTFSHRLDRHPDGRNGFVR